MTKVEISDSVYRDREGVNVSQLYGTRGHFALIPPLYREGRPRPARNPNLRIHANDAAVHVVRLHVLPRPPVQGKTPDPNLLIKTSPYDHLSQWVDG